ncbi:MAG TPA: nuclear transport factor 2 family protein [Candidatus Dormibacteraeota bacterium]
MTAIQESDLSSDRQRFDRDRDAYLALMRRVPEGAYAYLRPGDDYSVGGIAVHVNYVLDHYRLVLEAIAEAAYAECRPQEADDLETEARARARGALTSAEVAAELSRTERLHADLLEVAGRLTEPDRKAPVWYRGGSEPYPTNLRDVLGWLTEHYQEHVPQVEALIGEWRGAIGVVARFNEAFARSDVDAVMALMTDDCVFEDTEPSPDGQRYTGQAAVRAAWEKFFANTESPRFETEEIFAAGDRVVARWLFSWGGEGAGAGRVRGVDVFRVRDGKVAEKLSYVKG